MKAEVKLIAGHSFKKEELLYVSNVLLNLAGIDTEPKLDETGESGLYVNGMHAVSADELAELFNILSLKNEFITPKDSHGRTQESFSDNWHRSPVINIAAEKLMGKAGLKKESNFKIIFSHDIDWVTPRVPVGFMKYFQSRLKGRSNDWLNLRKSFDKKVFLRAIEKVLKIEKDAGIKPHCFLLSGPYGNGRYSSRYDSRWKEAKEVINIIKQHRCEIGLHGSYYAPDNNSYKEEAERLAEASGSEIIRHRNHYLRFNPETLCESMEQAGIRYEYSIGYNSNMGFRAGIASPYPLYNHVKKKVSAVTEIPLIFMERDAHLEDEQKALNSAAQIINEVKEYNGCASVLFHPESFAVEKRWYGFFMKFIDICKSSGADISGDIN